MKHLTQDHSARGALYIIGAAAAFSTMGALVRMLSVHMPGEVMVFWRNLFSLAFLLPWLLRLSLRHLGSRHTHLHVMRATSGLVSMYCLFYALGHLHIAAAMLLNQTATLFVPFIAFLWLKEYVPVKVRWAILIGFIGVVLVLRPGRGIISWPALIGLTSGIAAAFSVVTIRRALRTEPPTRIVFYFSLFGTLGSAIPLVWAWRTPNAHDFLLFILMGSLAATGQLLMTRGYALAPAATIGPFTYSSILFAALYGWLIWSEVPGGWFWAGALLIITGGIVALRGELRRTTVQN